MKKCPQCGREYDLTMSFCLDDGSELLYGPAQVEPDQENTLPFTSNEFKESHDRRVPASELPTRRSLRRTEPTAVFPDSGLAIRRNSWRIIAASVIMLGLVLGAGVMS